MKCRARNRIFISGSGLAITPEPDGHVISQMSNEPETATRRGQHPVDDPTDGAPRERRDATDGPPHRARRARELRQAAIPSVFDGVSAEANE